MENSWEKLSLNLKQLPKAHLVQTKTAGRGLVAKEELARNDVILEEMPFVVGPPQNIMTSPNFCANCSKPLKISLSKGKSNLIHYLVKICPFI